MYLKKGIMHRQDGVRIGVTENITRWFAGKGGMFDDFMTMILKNFKNSTTCCAVPPRLATIDVGALAGFMTVFPHYGFPSQSAPSFVSPFKHGERMMY